MTLLRNLLVILDYWRTPREVRVEFPHHASLYRQIAAGYAVMIVQSLPCWFVPVLIYLDGGVTFAVFIGGGFVLACGFAVFKVATAVNQKSRDLREGIAMVRRGADLCVRCCYPVDGMDRCPECGTPCASEPTPRNAPANP